MAPCPVLIRECSFFFFFYSIGNRVAEAGNNVHMCVSSVSPGLRGGFPGIGLKTVAVHIAPWQIFIWVVILIIEFQGFDIYDEA